MWHLFNSLLIYMCVRNQQVRPAPADFGLQIPESAFLSAVPSGILPYGRSARIPSSHPFLQETGCD